MYPVGKSNQQIGAAYNRKTVLRLIGYHGNLSRHALSELTGLRGSTMTYLVRNLLADGLVVQCGRGESLKAGIKPILLSLNPDWGWTAGVALRDDSTMMIMRDAAGKEVFVDEQSRDGGIEETKDQLVVALRAHLAQRPGTCLGIGIGVPGVVDYDTGRVLFSQLLDCRDYPLAAVLEEALGVPVHLRCNTSLAASAEARLGALRGEDDFLLVLIQHHTLNGLIVFASYGCALYNSGEVRTGAHYAAGELSGKLAPTELRLPADGLIEELGDEHAKMSASSKKLVDALADSMAALADLYDPSVFVLGGDTIIRSKAFIHALEQRVDQWSLDLPHRTARVLSGGLGDRAVALGGSLLALDKAIEASV